MSDLIFRKIELSDRETAQKLLKKSNFRGCEYTFGNNFVWRDVYKIEVCFYENYYFVKQLDGDNTRFFYPAGEGETERAIELLREYCGEKGLRLKILANKEKTEEITSLYSDVKAEAVRDFFDYVYLSENLENLIGKKYHAKRNHLNRFYENNWSFEKITKENLSECAELNRRWAEENVDAGDEEKLAEQIVVEESFKHYEELGYFGEAIRVNGRVEAFAFGEPSSDDCFVVHVEKSSRDYQGSYAAINNVLVRALNGKFVYINREDDAGADNLRKAKLSYFPAFMEEKYYLYFN